MPKDAGMTGLFVEGLLETVRVFSCGVKRKAAGGIWPGYDSTYEGVKGQLCVWKHIVVLSPVCLSVGLSVALSCDACPDQTQPLTSYRACRDTHASFNSDTMFLCERHVSGSFSCCCPSHMSHVPICPPLTCCSIHVQSKYSLCFHDM